MVNILRSHQTTHLTGIVNSSWTPFMTGVLDGDTLGLLMLGNALVKGDRLFVNTYAVARAEDADGSLSTYAFRVLIDGHPVYRRLVQGAIYSADPAVPGYHFNPIAGFYLGNNWSVPSVTDYYPGDYALYLQDPPVSGDVTKPDSDYVFISPNNLKYGQAELGIPSANLGASSGQVDDISNVDGGDFFVYDTTVNPGWYFDPKLPHRWTVEAICAPQNDVEVNMYLLACNIDVLQMNGGNTAGR